uniref:Uncharacterized protein n=1 Tax=Trichogramma kaykai TaxID=54128 RepID=A0ABD2VSB6_9HYME
MAQGDYEAYINQDANRDDAAYHTPGSLQVSLRRFGLNRCLGAHDPGLIVRLLILGATFNMYLPSWQWDVFFYFIFFFVGNQ